MTRFTDSARPTPCRRKRSERGSVPVEVAIIAPALIALVMLCLVAWRVMSAEGRVQSAATAGARAASLQASPAGATAAAEEAAAANLEDAGLACTTRRIRTSTGDLRPGGSVSVEVTCTATFDDIVLLAVPGSRTFQARATEVVDTWRGAGS